MLRLKLAVGALGLATLAACGGATPASTSVATSPPTAAPTVAAPSPVPTPDIPALGAQFLALLVPLNPAFTTMNNYLINSKGQTFAQVQKHTIIYVAALRTFDAGILSMPWPPQFLADARALVTADGVFEGNLSAAAAMTNYDTWLSAGETDLDNARTAAAIVRSDLTLPTRPAGASVY